MTLTRSRFRALAAVSVWALATTAGCAPNVASPDSNDGSGSQRIGGADFELDYATQQFSSPLDLLALTWEEETTLNFASGITLADCLASEGVESEPVYDRRQELSEMADRSIGVWSHDFAESYGYDIPPDSEGKTALLAAAESDEVQSVRGECRTSSEFTKFAGIPAEFNNELKPLVESSTTWGHRAYSSLGSKWRQCMSDAGVKIPDDEYYPSTLATMSTEEEITTALLDVDCKISTGFVEDWAAFNADTLAPAIELHRSEIDDFRKRAEPVIEEAREVIREYES